MMKNDLQGADDDICNILYTSSSVFVFHIYPLKANWITLGFCL